MRSWQNPGCAVLDDWESSKTKFGKPVFFPREVKSEEVAQR
jgi:hypothetical protein